MVSVLKLKDELDCLQRSKLNLHGMFHIKKKERKGSESFPGIAGILYEAAWRPWIRVTEHHTRGQHSSGIKVACSFCPGTKIIKCKVRSAQPGLELCPW